MIIWTLDSGLWTLPPGVYREVQEVLMSEEVVYRSVVEVERIRGPMRKARLPGREDDVTFGVHSEIAEHYGVSPDDYPPDTTTLDYVVAAAVG